MIADIIADWTGVPAGSVLKDELANLLQLESLLEQRVVGQSEAIHAIAQSLRAAKAGLKTNDSPLGVFLLSGPSGVGKTETALALADALFGGEKSLITINLSEYREAHTVSQLKGSPPGLCRLRRRRSIDRSRTSKTIQRRIAGRSRKSP